MLPDCCTQYLGRGEVVCPVCESQKQDNAQELKYAREFRQAPDELRSSTQELLHRRAISAQSVGVPSALHKQVLTQRNPSRRAVFQLLGIYLPEREAKALLTRVHDYKWIEAEKAGKDIWRCREPRAPLKAAAQNWASKYLPGFLEYAHA